MSDLISWQSIGEQKCIMASISYLCVAKNLLVLFLALEPCATLLLDCGRGDVFIEQGTYILATCNLKTNISAEAVYWSKFDDQIGFCHLLRGLCLRSQGIGIYYNLHIRNNDSFSLGISHEPTSSDYGEYYISFGEEGENILALNFTSFHRDNDSDSLYYTTSTTPFYDDDAENVSNQEYFQNNQRNSTSQAISMLITTMHPNSSKSSPNNYLNSVSSGTSHGTPKHIFLINFTIVLCVALFCSVGISLYLVGRKNRKLRLKSHINNRLAGGTTSNSESVAMQVISPEVMNSCQSTTNIQSLTIYPQPGQTVAHDAWQNKDNILTECGILPAESITIDPIVRETQLDLQCRKQETGLQMPNLRQEHLNCAPATYNENFYYTLEDLTADKHLGEETDQSCLEPSSFPNHEWSNIVCQNISEVTFKPAKNNKLSSDRVLEEEIDVLYSKPYKAVSSKKLMSSSSSGEPSSELWYQGKIIRDNTTKMPTHDGLQRRMLGGPGNSCLEDCLNRDVDRCTEQGNFLTVFWLILGQGPNPESLRCKLYTFCT